MQFETLLKRNKNLIKADGKIARATMDGFPVVGNTSGIREEEVIYSVEGSDVVSPVIGGVTMSATVVMYCQIIDTKGVLVPRIIFLSTLIRKLNLDAPYSGMLNEHPLFAKHAEFTNSVWVEKFKAAAPFQIETITPLEREINDVKSPTGKRMITVKELTLAKLTKAEADKLITSTGEADASKADMPKGKANGKGKTTASEDKPAE